MKLIAFDYDGTLISRWGDLTLFASQSIKKLQAAGHEIFVVTGRSYLSIYKALEKAGLNVGIISNNGNMLRHMGQLDQALKNPLDRQMVASILDLLEERGLEAVLHVDGWEREADLLLEREPQSFMMTSYVSYYSNRYRLASRAEIWEEDVLSVALYIKEEDYGALAKEIRAIYPRAQVHLLTRSQSSYKLMEVVGEDTNKWRALWSYAQSRGIKKEDIIAVGDDRNDQEMIKEAGLGIAMKDSLPELTSLADRVTQETAARDGAIKEVMDYLGIDYEVEDGDEYQLVSRAYEKNLGKNRRK
ncbi:MAG: HAD-IIB family hydrolase [Tissierellia bacterium]|nr:HAD-IIB family hydrolase [Tissierellia bacterium]